MPPVLTLSLSVAQVLIAEKKSEWLECLLPPPAVTETRAVEICEHCNQERGKVCILQADRILPCPHCATSGWTAKLEELERKRLERQNQRGAERAVTDEQPETIQAVAQ